MPSREIGAVGKGESVVITGISGRFPQSDNLNEFASNLYAKRDLVDDRELRYRHTVQNMPRRTGKVNDIDRFDCEFFGIDRRHRDTMDPQVRKLIEHSWEAILDAGVNPQRLRGTRTGVYCGICFSETESRMFYGVRPQEGLAVLGSKKSQLANMVSYILDLRGPSLVVDTACSSSMYALDLAYRAIMNGECDAALVAGSNLTLHPFITYQFALLGVMAKDDYCRPFDKDANGYSRAEAICVVYLQKAKYAKRIYSYVMNSKTNCDGYKSEGITYPSGAMQQQLLREFYEEIGIDPADVAYVEAHSTGTVVGDPEECDALDKVYCVQRDEPLAVGSVKSSIGHTEAAAGVCSIAKCIIAMENGLIPPNINFTENKPSIPALVEGRLKVIRESAALEGPLVGINCFGFGGANAHTLLCRNLKEKKHNGLPSDNLPRLVVWSGRTRKSLQTMFDAISSKPLDQEFIALLHNIQQYPTPGHRYRGFAICEKMNEKPASIRSSFADRVKLGQLPLVIVLGGINVRWREQLESLRQFEQFEITLAQCTKYLLTMKFDLMRIPSERQVILYDMVGTSVLQLATVNLLRSIGVEFDYYGGHSVGQFTCAYIDQCLTLEEVITLALWHGLAYSECEALCEGSVLVRMQSKVNQFSSESIEWNDDGSFAVLSDSESDVLDKIQKYKVTEVLTESLPYLSLIFDADKTLQLSNRLQQTINSNMYKFMNISKKWFTVTIPKTSGIFHSIKMHNSASIVNLLNNIPNHSLLLELDSGVSCQKVLHMLDRKINFLSPSHEPVDVISRFLGMVGHLYITGRNLDIAKLYPEVQFPVSRGTPMIAPLVEWDHRETAYVMAYQRDDYQCGVATYKISLNDVMYRYIEGHCIDGRVLFPATGYLYLVWDFVLSLKHLALNDCPIQFEDVRFLRATSITKEQTVNLEVSLQECSGFFEILEGDTVVVTGYVKNLPTDWKPPQLSDIPTEVVTLDSRDFYKELRLRGYHYRGLFQSVMKARMDGMLAKVQWHGNWVAFLDCLLQVGLVGLDSRSLKVPTSIEKLSINPSIHMEHLETVDGEDCITMKCCKKTGMAVCGGVAMTFPQTNTIERRAPPGIPVLERYHFVPYCSKNVVSIQEAIRSCVQIALENASLHSFDVAEIHSTNCSVIVDLFGKAVADIPLVKCNQTILTKETFEMENVTVTSESVGSLSNLLFVITSGDLLDSTYLESLSSALVDKGYVLLRHTGEFELPVDRLSAQFNVIASFSVEPKEFLLLLQRKSNVTIEEPTALQISSNPSDWLPHLKKLIKLQPVILYSQNNPTSGIIGLVNCIRREPGSHSVSCVFIDDPRAPPFDLSHPFYRTQLALGLAFNILRDGVWGSYRHELLQRTVRTETVEHHCYANCLVRGDLSSMSWFSGAMNELQEVPNMVRVMYSSLNFRDVMIATGRLSSDSMDLSRLDRECELGYEFAGVTRDGRRVMGVLGSGALATMVSCDPCMTWDVPSEWSLEEAATVPVVYGTVILAFFSCANIRGGKSVLIHAGSGGVGLAAIQVALAHGLEVFCTVGNQEKKDYLLQTYPTLKAQNIGNSRDTSFEKMIKVQTKGRGVDFVLNSLSEEKLQASIRCLAEGGHFLEIGKFDMARNSMLSMTTFRKGITFSSVMLDALFTEDSQRKQKFQEMFAKTLASGVIKPLRTTVFAATDLEKAIRFLATGKHIGKVLLKMRQQETDLGTLPLSYIPRVHCNPEQVVVIVGGLGGFGLELADWLVLRGCRKLIFSSSRGISKPYQEYRIEIWRKYGVQVAVCTANITTNEGCEELLKLACSYGVVCGIFNLAVRLRDSILENQSTEAFEECLAPKAKATTYLDRLSRELCPQLKHFVVFSSVSCGRGNAGQSNYGMANSVMERIMERRHAAGLPAKAIQWGAVGDVGLVADMAENRIDLEIGGTLQQRIASCLQELDTLLGCDDPIVASMVVAEKRLGSGTKNIIEAVMNIMNIRELKSVSMESTLAEIGMDSLMAVEIKQVLEREFELILTPQDLRTLTFSKLNKISEARKQNIEPEIITDGSVGLQLLLRNLGDEKYSKNTVLKLSSARSHGRPVLFIPGVEGVGGNVWHSIAKEVKAPVFLLQTMKSVDSESVAEMVDSIFDELFNTVFDEYDSFVIVAYSFGSLLGMNIAKRLQEKGMFGKLMLLDGAPKQLHLMIVNSMNENTSDEHLQTALISAIIPAVLPNLALENIRHILDASTYEDRIERFIEKLTDIVGYSPEYMRVLLRALFKRLKCLMTLNLDDFKQLEMPICLVKPSDMSLKDIENDYDLSQYTKAEVSVQIIEGNHMTMLDNTSLPEVINRFDM